MQLGVSLEPPAWSEEDGGRVLETARRAEHLGFDYVLMSSHMLRNRIGSALDPFVMLAAVAGATSRIRLATSVLVVPYYDPVMLANTVASMDVLSGGRFVLAAGTGWNPEEYAAIGVPLSERGARTDENLRILRALWETEPVTYTGRFARLEEAVAGVRPRTPGGPAVWIGGNSEAALRRVVRFGDGWHGRGVDHTTAADVRSRLAALGERTGRDTSALTLTTVGFLTPPGFTPAQPAPGRPLGGTRATLDSVVEDLTRLHTAGVSMCSLWMPLDGPGLADALHWVAEELRPALP
ncbi:TIGR03619 family F420-dependent LLM class oxidoreductase [Streptomyces rhizosphaericus]|uniref:TIGR03619 family F420-dependent LLM class oxidoreductase n=1 Tax=Streptomyces rhizosphaericus TaxID=114699 RepID=UPI002892CB41|nr:TIGR03619 family F420-dependent LLM class oxidoreductase [Streptomyces rhizosphaericus]